MRTAKESSIRVAEVIKKINQLTKGTYEEEKVEIITNICESYDMSISHIMNVGDFNFNKPK